MISSPSSLDVSSSSVISSGLAVAEVVDTGISGLLRAVVVEAVTGTAKIKSLIIKDFFIY